MSHDATLNDDGGHGHGEHGHDHPEFLAHHFDDPEQQYDSGKLGIWLFLVTEVLFFSGMFCAYALYRSRNPEVFNFSSQYLNATLGAFNTGVLLFSSLSMAWGVRCAQLRQRTGLVICLAITLGCAAMFLGVKAIEYTHKWEMGLLPAGSYVSQYSVLEHHAGVSDWLYVLSAVPAICVVGFGIWFAITLVQGKRRLSEIAGPLLVTGLCYFLGVFIGIAFQNAEEAKADHGVAAHSGANDHAGPSDDSGHSGESHDDSNHSQATEEHSEDHGSEDHGSEDHGSEDHGSEDHGTEPSAEAGAMTPGRLVASVSSEQSNRIPVARTTAAIDQPAGAGLFFSIYYCMTGVHAIHILGGMAVLAWLLVRATKDQFNEQYFGPVDYVGLYWHLVDLIWIYLFPLLYLIK